MSFKIRGSKKGNYSRLIFCNELINYSMFTATKYYIFIFHETLVLVKGENY